MSPASDGDARATAWGVGPVGGGALAEGVTGAGRQRPVGSGVAPPVRQAHEPQGRRNWEVIR